MSENYRQIMKRKVAEIEAKEKPQTHTPTPWKVMNRTDKQVSGYIHSTELGIDKGHVGLVKPQDAAFIVRVVNAHEELIEALKRLANITNAKKGSVKASIVAEAWEASAKAEGL